MPLILNHTTSGYYRWFIRKYGLLNSVTLQALQPEGPSVWQVGNHTLQIDLVRLMQLLHAAILPFEASADSHSRWNFRQRYFSEDAYEYLAYALQPEFHPAERWDYLQKSLAEDHEIGGCKERLAAAELWPLFLQELQQNLAQVEYWCSQHLVGRTMDSLQPFVDAVDGITDEADLFKLREAWLGMGQPFCALLSWGNAVVCPERNREAAVFFWPQDSGDSALQVDAAHLDWDRLWVMDYYLADMLVEYETVGHVAVFPDDEGNPLTLTKAKELAKRYWQRAVPFREYIRDPEAVVETFFKPDWTERRAEVLYFGDVPPQFVQHPATGDWFGSAPLDAGPESERFIVTV